MSFINTEVSKRRRVTLLSVMLVMGCFASAVPEVNAIAPRTSAESAILLDAESGQVLFSKSPDLKLPPASITKVMTMLLVMDDVDAGRLKLSDRVKASALAASMGGSQIYLKENEEMSLGELIKAIAVVSANDACVAVAEYTAGSEEDFVDRMNRRAKGLGMVNTNFVNTNGLPAENHYSSARDIAIMSRALIKHKKIIEYSSIWTDTLRNGKFHLRNTNELISKYTGADGLKTGWTDEAGFCLSGTAKRDGVRLIAVVMKTPSNNARFQETAKLLDYGFRNFDKQTYAKKGQVKAVVKVQRGAKEMLNLVVKDDFRLMVPKGTEKSVKVVSSVDEKVTAPIKKGQVLGRLDVMKGGSRLGSVPLIASEPVDKANPIVLIFRSIRDFFKALLTFGRS